MSEPSSASGRSGAVRAPVVGVGGCGGCWCHSGSLLRPATSGPPSASQV
jgi:hypothetical protein